MFGGSCEVLNGTSGISQEPLEISSFCLKHLIPELRANKKVGRRFFLSDVNLHVKTRFEFSEHCTVHLISALAHVTLKPITYLDSLYQITYSLTLESTL